MTKVCSTFDDVGEFGKTPKTSGAASSTEPDSYLKFDWSTEGPPIDAAVESAVELHMDWSADGPRPDETRWSAWLPNGLTGSAAEWYWVSTDRQMRAFVKNTFLDEEDASRTDDRPARHVACLQKSPMRPSASFLGILLLVVFFLLAASECPTTHYGSPDTSDFGLNQCVGLQYVQPLSFVMPLVVSHVPTCYCCISVAP